jgi:hypothetical protein
MVHSLTYHPENGEPGDGSSVDGGGSLVGIVKRRDLRSNSRSDFLTQTYFYQCVKPTKTKQKTKRTAPRVRLAHRYDRVVDVNTEVLRGQVPETTELDC